jgi:hypothetical protein
LGEQEVVFVEIGKGRARHERDARLSRFHQISLRPIMTLSVGRSHWLSIPAERAKAA